MLVLSRKKNERICIGDDVELTVVDIRGDKVRIGIDAPSRIPVHRREVKDAIDREAKRIAGPTEAPPDDVRQVTDEQADVKTDAA